MKIQVKIPEKTKILVKPGQKVDFSTPLAQITQVQLVSIPIAEMMGFPPANIFHHLKQVIGDEIKKGDILAEHKSLFSTKKYLSEVAGILREIKHDAGTISIEQIQDSSRLINCFFVGEIDGIYDGYLEIQVEDVHSVKMRKQTEYFGASIFYLDRGKRYSDEDLDGVCVFASEIDPLETVKMETLGAQGLITKQNNTKTKIRQILLEDEKDFEHIQKKCYPYVIIGHEPMTVLFYK